MSDHTAVNNKEGYGDSSHHHRQHADQINSSPHRKFANPGPLGLCAFALTTFVLSLINVQTRGVVEPNIVLGLAFGYGGLVQLLAGMWEFAVGNTFGATALSSYGGFWISYAYIIAGGNNSYGVIAGYEASPKDLENALGFYLIAWFIFNTILCIGTLKTTLAFFLLFFFLDLTFLLLAIGHFQATDGKENVNCIKAGGVLGLITAFIAWYNAAVGLWNSENTFVTPSAYDLPWSEKKRQARSAV
jgi:hypothetical protein